MHHKLSRITDVKNLRGKRVLLRASLNVPVQNGVVQNTFRLDQILPTVTYLREQGARVILMGHIGREETESLAPVYDVLKEKVEGLLWCKETVSEKVRDVVNTLVDGDVMLIENLRSHEGEVENDPLFAAGLASLGDIYVNDAFSDSHREHASIVGVPKHLPSYVGETFYKEVTELEKALSPKHPALFILGGAKFETKEPLIRKFLNTYDRVFIGGAIANDFLKSRGMEVGHSKVSGSQIASEVLHHAKIMLPEKVIVRTETGAREERTVSAVTATDEILDALLPEQVMDGTQTIVWNGPLGYYEGGFCEGTLAVVRRAAESDAYTIVGGGDTVAAIDSLGLNSKFNFVSTAGGAMLTFLEAGTLPGIEALRKKNFFQRLFSK